MRRVAAILIILATGASFSPVNSRAAVVYRQGEGWTSEAPGDESGAIESTASAQMSKAEQFESEGDTGRALGAYKGLVRKFPGSLTAPKAQLKVGQLLEGAGDAEAAFDAYGKYISKYPRGDDFDTAVGGQFRIAKLFLEGERKKVFGVKTFSSMERAQTMFEAVVKNAPFSKYAAQAQFYAAQSLERQGKTAEALTAYEAVISRYPGDPIAADAQYQIGYVYFKQRQDGVNDPAVATKARDALDDFIARYPNSEKVPQAKENLAALSSGRTKGLLEVAKFYDKTKNYKAAVIYYNNIIKQDAGSEDAAYAKQRIQELRDLVGDEVLKPGPEKAETGTRAAARRRAQAQIDTVSRPDFVGPPVAVPEQTPPPKPRLRTSTGPSGPMPRPVEPALPE
jgi:outer membrane protein assembly factor BamD